MRTGMSVLLPPRLKDEILASMSGYCYEQADQGARNGEHSRRIVPGKRLSGAKPFSLPSSRRLPRSPSSAHEVF